MVGLISLGSWCPEEPPLGQEFRCVRCEADSKAMSFWKLRHNCKETERSVSATL